MPNDPVAGRARAELMTRLDEMRCAIHPMTTTCAKRIEYKHACCQLGDGRWGLCVNCSLYKDLLPLLAGLGETAPSPLLIHAIRAEAQRARAWGAGITADLLEQEADKLAADVLPAQEPPLERNIAPKLNRALRSAEKTTRDMKKAFGLDPSSPTTDETP